MSYYQNEPGQFWQYNDYIGNKFYYEFRKLKEFIFC